MQNYTNEVVHFKRIRFENSVSRIVYFLFQLTSFFTFIIWLVSTVPYYRKWMILLPFSFFVINLLFIHNFRKITSNITVLMILTMFYCRFVIIPLFYLLSSQEQLFAGTASVFNHITQASLLMVYEYFAIQLTIMIYKNRRRYIKFKSIKLVFRIDWYKALFFLLVVYIIVVGIFLPESFWVFKSILNLREVDYTTSFGRIIYSVGTVKRAVLTLFSMVFFIIRVLLPAYILYKCKENRQDRRWCDVMLFIMCFLQFFFLTSTFAEALVACLVIILFYTKLFPKRKEKIYILLFGFTVGMLLLYFVVRYTVRVHSRDNTDFISYIAQILNAYFTGIDNVAAIFNLPFGHETEVLRADILGALPFNSTLLGDVGNKLEYYYNKYNGSYGQIPPTLGTGIYMVGPFLSPLFSVMLTIASLYYQRLAEKNVNNMKYVVYICTSMVFALGTVMYSTAIVLSWYFSKCIPLLIIMLFTKNDEIKSKDYEVANYE